MGAIYMRQYGLKERPGFYILSLSTCERIALWIDRMSQCHFQDQINCAPIKEVRSKFLAPIVHYTLLYEENFYHLAAQP